MRWQGDVKDVPPHLVRSLPFQAGFFCDTEDADAYAIEVSNMLTQLQEMAEQVDPGEFVTHGVLLDGDGREYVPDHLLRNEKEFPNFSRLVAYQVKINNIMAILVFLAWIKLFKYISFNKTMLQLQNTLSSCAGDVAGSRPRASPPHEGPVA